MANSIFLCRKSKQSELLRFTGEKSGKELKIATPSLNSPSWLWSRQPQGLTVTQAHRDRHHCSHSVLPIGFWNLENTFLFSFLLFFFFNYSVIVTPWRFTAKCSKIKSWSLDQTQISCLFKTVNCIGQIPSFWHNSADLERATHTL